MFRFFTQRNWFIWSWFGSAIILSSLLLGIYALFGIETENDDDDSDSGSGGLMQPI